MKRWLAIVAALALVAAAAFGLRIWLDRPDPSKMTIFPGVSGPDAATQVETPAATPLTAFDTGGEHRLAIVVTDPDSGWLGLVRGFRAQGVPITVTQDVDKALRHRVVLVYPIISGRVLQAHQLRALAGHVRGGGTVLAFNLAGGGLEDLFGVGEGRELSSRTRLNWTTASGEARQDQIVVSGTGETKVGSVGYAAGTARALARFDDGSVGVACRTVGGQACVLGVDLGALAQRAMNGRAESMARTYVNEYEPSLDVLFRWVRDLYVAGEPTPWLVSTAPAGSEVSIVFSHDVDAQTAPANAVAYAQALRRRGVGGTFFVQTKYMTDYNDVAFFNEAAVADTRKLTDLGMDVGSHTVAHSNAFERMPLGDGQERYPAYRPFVVDDATVRDASILGELRVSKYLLEHLAGAKVQAFRPGRLSYPFSLPQAMKASGYRYSSSITANVVLSHLPFQLTDGRANAALQPIWEFPVAIEDEAPPRLGDRIDAADRLIGQIANDRGVAVILIHPNITGHKLAFEAAIADRWAGRAWMGSVSDFGAWWAARDALDIDVASEGGRPVLRVRSAQPINAASIIFPKTRREVRVDLPAGGGTTIPLS